VGGLRILRQLLATTGSGRQGGLPCCAGQMGDMIDTNVMAKSGSNRPERVRRVRWAAGIHAKELKSFCSTKRNRNHDAWIAMSANDRNGAGLVGDNGRSSSQGAACKRLRPKACVTPAGADTGGQASNICTRRTAQPYESG